MPLADGSAVFPADGNTSACLELYFRLADGAYVLHINNVRSMRPYKKHGIEAVCQILKPSVERIGLFRCMEGDTAQMRFKIYDLLQWNLVLCPVNVEEKHFLPVRTVVHGVRQRFLKYVPVDWFEDKAVG